MQKPSPYYITLLTPLSGSPLLYFGDGTCAANAICETELADYLIDCALDPGAKDMVNQTRDIGEKDGCDAMGWDGMTRRRGVMR